jgi:hypothetical protein
MPGVIHKLTVKVLKFFFVLLFPLLMVFSSSAQFVYGFKAGANISNMRIENGARNVILGDFRAKPGFNAGFIGEIPVNSWLSVQFQVNYDQRGVNYFEEKYELGNRTSIDGNINLHYIETPLFIKYHKVLNEKKKRGVHVKLGPELAYLLAGMLNGTKSYNDETSDINETVVANTSALSIGLSAAAGFFFPIKHIRAFLEMRYSYGITNDFQGTEDIPSNELDAYGNVISINFGMIGFSRWDKY